jgi:large subunit ribosomal protein L28
VLCVNTRSDSLPGEDGPIERSLKQRSQAFNPAARNTKVWSEVMAQVCDICGKGPQFGNNISHAHNVSRRRWNVNLQAVKALVNGASKRIRVCTSCIKTGKITKG